MMIAMKHEKYSSIWNHFWDAASRWNHTWRKTRTRSSYIINIMAADVLATQWARTSTAMVFTRIWRNSDCNTRTDNLLCQSNAWTNDYLDAKLQIILKNQTLQIICAAKPPLTCPHRWTIDGDIYLLTFYLHVESKYCSGVLVTRRLSIKHSYWHLSIMERLPSGFYSQLHVVCTCKWGTFRVFTQR